MSIEKDLIKYGLNEREALVYISLLKLSDSTAFLIAKDVDLPRTTVYETLEDLKRKGLLSVWKKNNVNYYSPESPNVLLKQHKEKEELLNSVVPELFSYIKMNGKVPSAKFYTGKEGVKIVLDDVIERSIDQKLNIIHSIIRPEFNDYFPKIMTEWIQRREEKNIYIQIIIPDIPVDEKKLSYFKNDLRETRVMKKDYPLGSSIFIYGNKTALFSLEDNQMYATVIESAPFSSMFKSMFGAVWDTLLNQ